MSVIPEAVLNTNKQKSHSEIPFLTIDGENTKHDWMLSRRDCADDCTCSHLGVELSFFPF